MRLNKAWPNEGEYKKSLLQSSASDVKYRIDFTKQNIKSTQFRKSCDEIELIRK